jgi:hypothetical protein
MVFVQGPFEGIVEDVGPVLVKIILVSQDMFVETPLPKRSAGCVAKFIYLAGRKGFESANDFRQTNEPVSACSDLARPTQSHPPGNDFP